LDGRYLYTDTWDEVQDELVASVMKLSDMYQVEGLYTKCLHYLSTAITVGNAVSTS
jgi:hypothetical protein